MKRQRTHEAPKLQPVAKTAYQQLPSAAVELVKSTNELEEVIDDLKGHLAMSDSVDGVLPSILERLEAIDARRERANVEVLELLVKAR